MKQARARMVACPQCGKPVEWSLNNRFRPFCSERCKLIDLGAWAAESYRVPVAEDPADAAEHSEDEDSSTTKDKRAPARGSRK